MATRRRTTEKHPHAVWKKFVDTFKIVEIEGLIYECYDNELKDATVGKQCNIPLHCIEAVECDNYEDFDYLKFFTKDEWINKVAVAEFFGTMLKLITHVKNDGYLFRLHEISVKEGVLKFEETQQFKEEEAFIRYWKTLKKLSQKKPQVEARPRQALTLIDGILEKHGLQWGGNVDGFVLNDHNEVVAIIELRQSRKTRVEYYDPAQYFLGTSSKGGDFKTWLPLVYLQKAYDLPLILLTVSTLDSDKLGFAEIRGINEKKLFYTNDLSPKYNVTDDFQRFEK